jgi:hypothetical protein
MYEYHNIKHTYPDSVTPVCLGRSAYCSNPARKQTPGSILVSKLKQIHCSFKSLLPFNHPVIKKTYLFAYRTRIIASFLNQAFMLIFL